MNNACLGSRCCKAVHFMGVTMTDTLLKVLVCLPNLEHLAFFILLLAGKPYQQSSFDIFFFDS